MEYRGGIVSSSAFGQVFEYDFEYRPRIIILRKISDVNAIRIYQHVR